MAKSSKVNKSADTGRFVTQKHADKNPKTTYQTTVKKGPTKHRR